MFEWIRAIRDALGIESTRAFVLIMFFIGGAAGGTVGFIVDRYDKRSVVKTKDLSGQLTSSPRAAEQSTSTVHPQQAPDVPLIEIAPSAKRTQVTGNTFNNPRGTAIKDAGSDSNIASNRFNFSQQNNANRFRSDFTLLADQLDQTAARTSKVEELIRTTHRRYAKDWKHLPIAEKQVLFDDLKHFENIVRGLEEDKAALTAFTKWLREQPSNQ